MAALTAAAKAEIRASGLTVEAYTRSMGWFDLVDGTWVPGAGKKWRGDECGCDDDRCIGFHHDENEECGCLPVLIDQATAGQQSRLRSRTIARRVVPSEAGSTIHGIP